VLAEKKTFRGETVAALQFCTRLEAAYERRRSAAKTSGSILTEGELEWKQWER